MAPDEALATLGRALRRLIRSEGLRLGEFSRKLGFGPDYLGRAFRGRYPLRVELVFEILQRLTVLPFEFFDSVFPFGGPVTLKAAKTRGVSDLPGEQRWAHYFRDQLLEQRPRCVGEHAEHFRQWLRHAIEDREQTQRRISEALGRGPTALGQALRGNTELTFFHVFGVLHHLEVSPARFFVEAFGREAGNPAERIRRLRTLDYFERVLETTGAKYFARRSTSAGGPGAPATSPPEKGSPGQGEERE